MTAREVATEQAREALEQASRVMGSAVEVAADGFLHFPKRMAVGCPHVSPTEPSLAFVLIAEPTLVRCPECVIAASARIIACEPDTCDRCRKVVEGNRFTEVMVRTGPLIWVGNVCPNCMAAGKGLS